MFRILSKEESQEMHRELLKWLEDTLEGEYGPFIYNIIINTKHIVEKKQEKKDKAP